MFDRLTLIVIGYCIFAILVLVIRYLWVSRRKHVEPSEDESLPDDEELISDEVNSEHENETQISEERNLELKQELASKKNLISLLKMQTKRLLAMCDESSEDVNAGKQKYQKTYDSLNTMMPDSPTTYQQLKTAISLRDSQINETQLFIKLLKEHMEENK